MSKTSSDKSTVVGGGITRLHNVQRSASHVEPPVSPHEPRALGPTDPTSNNNISTSLSTEFTGTYSGRYGRRTVQTVLAAEWMDVLGLYVAGRLWFETVLKLAFPLYSSQDTYTIQTRTLFVVYSKVIPGSTRVLSARQTVGLNLVIPS